MAKKIEIDLKKEDDPKTLKSLIIKLKSIIQSMQNENKDLRKEIKELKKNLI